MLSTTLPSSVLAGYTLDRDNNGVDIQDVVRALQDSQAAVAITGKSTFDKADVQNLLSQIQPISQRSVKGTITGYVLDETGETVPGAEVVLVDLGLTVLTDASGKFEFNNVPAMYQAKVRVHKADYTDVYSEAFNILPGNSLVLDNLFLTSIPSLGSVAGYVFTADQQPLESALVTLNGPAGTRNARSDTRGYFYLDAVPTGNWNVTVTKDTYIRDELTLTVTANSLVTMPPVYLEKAVNTQPTGSIVGVVKSDVDQPLQGAQVSVTGTTYQAFTDATGTFMLTQIPYGAADLDIAMAGYQTAHISGVPVTADVYNTGTTRLISQGVIGVVRDSEGGAALSNVSIHLEATDGSYAKTITSDADGKFSYTQVPPNKAYTISVTYAGYLLYPMQPFMVNQGQSTVKEIYLQRGAAVSTEHELLDALADPMVPYILVLDDIHLTRPYAFNRSVQLQGISGSHTQLTAPSFTMDTSSSYPNVSFGDLDMYSDVGNDETNLQAALSSFLGSIKVNGFAGYTGMIQRKDSANYFVAGEGSELTAYVQDAQGLLGALSNANVATIYMARDITVYNDLAFPDRPIRLTSQTQKVLATNQYTHAEQIQLSNVSLLPDSTPPQLSGITTGVVELESQQVKATSNEPAILYLVPAETSSNAEDIAAHYVAKTNAINDEEASIELLNVPQGDYVLYAIDAAGNVSNPSDMINVRKSVANALLTIRNGLHIANMAGVTKYDYERAGLHSLYNEQLDLYGFALNMDKDALLSVIDDHDFVDKMQVWVDTANETPVIQRALMSGFFSGHSNFDWSYLNANAESILTSYHLSGIYSTSQLIAAEHLMEQAYKQGNYKLLFKEVIQNAIDCSVPSPEQSGWTGDPVPQGPGTKQVALSLSLRNANGDSLQGYTAEDFSVKVGQEQLSLGDTEFFPSFAYDDSSKTYRIMFKGSEDSASYVLSNLSLQGTVILEQPLSVTTPVSDYSTEYAAQIVSQHLKADGSNVVVTFKLASSSGEGITGLTALDVKAKVGGETRGIFDPDMFTNFTDLGGGVYSFEVLESVLASPIILDNLTAQVDGADITIATAVSVNRQAALIEQAVAVHNQGILSGTLLLTGNLINSLADIDLINLLSLNQNLQLAYGAHGNELTEASIRRIINGMKLLAGQSQSLDDVADTYGLVFKQNVTGDVRTSVNVRNSSGYLSNYGASSSGNHYEFSFEHTAEYPVVLTYIATDEEKLAYASDGSAVPDFEIIFTFPLA